MEVFREFKLCLEKLNIFVLHAFWRSSHNIEWDLGLKIGTSDHVVDFQLISSYSLKFESFT